MFTNIKVKYFSIIPNNFGNTFFTYIQKGRNNRNNIHSFLSQLKVLLLRASTIVVRLRFD